MSINARQSERQSKSRINSTDTLEKLEEYIERTPQFSDEDVILIHQMVAAFRGWQALGKATKWVLLSLAAISGLVTALINIRDSIKLWLQ